MKHKKHKNKSERDRRKSKKKSKKKHKRKRSSDSDTSSSISENEHEWVEKIAPASTSKEEGASVVLSGKEPMEREDWMSMKSVFPCVFNEKKMEPFNANKNTKKPELHELGQSDRELNPYWKNGGTGIPEARASSAEHVVDVNWLKKSLHRAREQAKSENKSLEEVAAERWGSLEIIESMISKAESAFIGRKSSYASQTFEKGSHKSRFKNPEEYEKSRYQDKPTHSHKSDQYKSNDNSYHVSQGKQGSENPFSDTFSSTTSKMNRHGKKNWQKCNVPHETKKDQSETSIDVVESVPSNTANNMETNETKLLTEAEMNKLGAKIVKAEIVGNAELANELKTQLKKAREAAKSSQLEKKQQVENVILTHTDAKGVTRPLESVKQHTESTKRKNIETHSSGKKVRHFFDDDKYSLKQLFHKEKGRSVNEDEAVFVRVASKNMDMDEMFEEQITHVKAGLKQEARDRQHAIKEHKQLSKSLNTCRWCIESEHMLKHMIITMDSDICLSLPQYTSLTTGHCIVFPIQHVACQLQLDENIWDKLKIFKQALYKMFLDQNLYPVFYEVYKSRHKFPHMRLECVPLPMKVGELAPMYFKKALLECETEWSMNKKVIDLNQKDIRQAIPNGLSYFMVEFEKNKGYAHVIEDEQMFPNHFAEEIVAGMLELGHDAWRKPKKENFDEQLKKVQEFSRMWKNYKIEIKQH